MKLYHGSNMVIEQIDLSKSKPYKDFGRGFYLSDNEEQAKAMANQKVVQLETGKVTVNVYEFDERHLNDGSLKVKLFESYCTEWAEFILANRNKAGKKWFMIMML